MKEKIIFYYNKNNLINPLMFLILGIILFTNPGGILKFISYIIGFILCIIGLINILSYRKTLKKLNIDQKSKLISGILLIIIGLIIAVFYAFIETTIRLTAGALFIYSGIMHLIECLNDKGIKSIFTTKLIISILMIICGFYVLLTVNLVFKFIGLAIMIYAVMEIVNYIICFKK